jgi:hypothetical protein
LKPVVLHAHVAGVIRAVPNGPPARGPFIVGATLWRLHESAGLPAGETARCSYRGVASVSHVERQTTALDDEEERRVRLLLLGKAAVLTHRYERPLAAEMDDDQQSRRADWRHRGARSR